ncbi:DUF4990 domain-containing protein [Blastopirellula sp. JC732]|uniref:DUF4990 domain-containing protein n=1 Tax=Blastopirellula sediminis TaxID=2894196 RepID=A0A9X1MJN7_9BACT|nr:DUF4990 domain-containing protein [Blastopirellula sediminis]MCC9609679.1 DUF4990 domain-containing protein [Blastopirellula sediminis]MCC9627545.1 DUF4990 domain-containing protein [Blastopirellula sediminis]
MLSLRIAVVLGIATIANLAVAADWFVAPDGDDAQSGKIDAPLATVTKGQELASPGDTVYIRGGLYNDFAELPRVGWYNVAIHLKKSDVSYVAYPGETPVFDFSKAPTNRRVTGFLISGTNVTMRGIHVTGTPVGEQKQSECFRIAGSRAVGHFYDCVARGNAAIGFYWTSGSRGSATRCDAYDNISRNPKSIGNIDGFGAHAEGVEFRYCRAWNNSDDGFDAISSPGANLFDHCWAFNHRAGGDSNGFKIGGFGADPKTKLPVPLPVHEVRFCIAAFNGAKGFYANHHPGQAAVWTRNSAYGNGGGNFNMLERRPDMSEDIPGDKEVLHGNLAFRGPSTKADATPAENATDNSWTRPGVTVDAKDFVSVDWKELMRPRTPEGDLPHIDFLRLKADSDLQGLGAVE